MSGDREVVIDTTVFSNFARTDSVEELTAAFEGTTCVTPPVIRELQRGRDDGYAFLKNATELLPPPESISSERSYQISRASAFSESMYDNNQVGKVAEVTQITADQYGYKLGEGEAKKFASECLELDLGEASVLQRAFATGGVAATDDGDARTLADAYDISYTGSIGLLARCVKRDIIDTATANNWLELWIEDNGYYSPVTDITEVL